MKDGPDIARIGALIGDPGRANMLAALMSGKALTAGELASEAGVSRQTASGHLAQMRDGGLLAEEQQGRHRYFRLLDEDVAAVLESMMALASRRGQMRTRTGPRDAELRHARVCYNHLAGELGVALYDALQSQGFLIETSALELTAAGSRHLEQMGIDLTAGRSRAPLCRACLDWSVRRPHLAGRAGRAILSHVLDRGWAARLPESRVIRFSGSGRLAFQESFKIAV